MRGAGQLRGLLSSLARLPGPACEGPVGCRLASGVAEREASAARGGLALREPYPLKDRGLRVAVPNRAAAARELSRLSQTLRRTGVLRKAQEQQVHVSPSEQRVLDRKAGQQKRAKERFRRLMGYIIARKERGF